MSLNIFYLSREIPQLYVKLFYSKDFIAFQELISIATSNSQFFLQLHEIDILLSHIIPTFPCGLFFKKIIYLLQMLLCCIYHMSLRDFITKNAMYKMTVIHKLSIKPTKFYVAIPFNINHYTLKQKQISLQSKSSQIHSKHLSCLNLKDTLKDPHIAFKHSLNIRQEFGVLIFGGKSFPREDLLL